MELLRSFLGNDSFFGRMMYRLGVVVISNLLFIACSIPVVTVGASLSGMYYLCLKARRDKCRGNVRIIRTFFKGFRDNFKQATLGWLAMLLFAVILLLEISWCNQFTAPFSAFKYGLIGLLVLDAVRVSVGAVRVWAGGLALFILPPQAVCAVPVAAGCRRRPRRRGTDGGRSDDAG